MHYFLVMRTLIALLVLGSGICFPGWTSRICRAIERRGRSLAARPWLAMALLALLGPLVRLALLPVMRVPQPSVHDEFSYLLAAKTFAQGRLTNPTHPLWIHFETFHEDHVPTYMSIYPPAQGLMLALGVVLVNQPWCGVVISIGLMSAAVYWMMQAWLPPGWALLGGILLVLRIGIFNYWMNSYWGGAVPTIGGALLLGALPRLLKRPRISYALAIGAGLAILANSRPYEGVLLALPVAGALVLWLWRVMRQYHFTLALRVTGPLAAVLVLTAAAMGYYNWRLFGSPLILPYQINQAAYAVTPILLFQSPQPNVVYRHPVMQRYYMTWWRSAYDQARTPGGFARLAFRKVKTVAEFFLGALLSFPLLILPYTIRDRRIRFLLLAGAFFFVGSLANVFTYPHYYAPITGLLYVVVIQCMRHLRQLRVRGRALGFFAVRALVALVFFSCIVQMVQAAAEPEPDSPRTVVTRTLQQLPGQHLVIVRYSPLHDTMHEWVYNAPDIDAARIVWAHDMGPEQNRELLRYFSARQAWLLDADSRPPRLRPYSAALNSQPAGTP